MAGAEFDTGTALPVALHEVKLGQHERRATT